MKKLLFIMTVVPALLFSCSKKDKGSPATEAEQLQTNVQGKWAFTGSIEVNGIRAGHMKITAPATQVNSTNTTPSNGFIEFLSDSTYMIYDSDGNYFTGKYTATSGTTINLSNFGNINEIVFTNGTISFKLYYTESNKTITITANKAAVITDNSANSKLLARTWYLTKEADGADAFTDEYEAYDEEGNVIDTYLPDSLTFTMSASGTYIVQIYENKILKSAEVANWKWHSTKSDRFVYWWNNEPNEEEDYIIINELSSNLLKMSEPGEDDNGNEKLFVYVLKPAK